MCSRSFRFSSLVAFTVITTAMTGFAQASILPGDLLISELLANPGAASDTSGEWFELYNASASVIDLAGVKVRDEGSNVFTISGSLLINPGDYLVLGRSADTTVNGGYVPDYVFSGFTLGNTSDAIIVESNGSVIASLIYNSAALYGANGKSTELIWNGNTFSYQLTPTNLKFGAGDVGTPGFAGSSALPVAASQVPVPGAMWLMGSGLVGLAGVARRRNV